MRGFWSSFKKHTSIRESSIENALGLGLRHLSFPAFFLCNLGQVTPLSNSLVRWPFIQQEQKVCLLANCVLYGMLSSFFLMEFSFEMTSKLFQL